MKRRAFLTLAGCVPMARLALASAQVAPRIAKVGVLWHADNAEQEGSYLSAFREGLRERGYIEGKTIDVENRFAAEQYDRFNALAEELVRLNLDVVVASTRLAALALQRATSRIPVVFVVVPDPVRDHLVESLARPGGNMTGVTTLAADLNAKRMEVFAQAVVGMTRMAMLVNPGDRETARRSVEEYQLAARALRLGVTLVEAAAPDRLEDAFSSITSAKLDGVIVTPDPMLYNERARIAELALQRRLPVMGFNGDMVRAGALLSYGPNYVALFRRAAFYVDRILKGTKPADLPIEQPTTFELVINQRTAKVLNLTIPQSILQRADELVQRLSDKHVALGI